MTTSIASIGLNYDSVDIQDADLGIFFQITQGLNEPGEVRGRDVVVPSLPGQIPRNRVFHQLKILLAGVVRGNGSEQEDRLVDYRASSRMLRLLFATDRSPADLVATLEDGSLATISCRPNSPAIWNEVIQSEFAYVSIELLAVEDWDFSDVGS